LLQILTMPLDRSAEGPQVHAIGSDADGSAAAACAERQDLIEAVEQPGPFLFVNEPLDLRAIGRELGTGKPALEVLQRLLLRGAVGLDSLKSFASLAEQIHHVSPDVCMRFSADHFCAAHFSLMNRIPCV